MPAAPAATLVARGAGSPAAAGRAATLAPHAGGPPTPAERAAARAARQAARRPRASRPAAAPRGATWARLGAPDPGRWVAGPLGLVAIVVLAVLGIALAAQAVLTVVWQDPVTAVRHARAQDRLDGELAALEARSGPLRLDGRRVPALSPEAVPLGLTLDAPVPALRTLRRGPAPSRRRAVAAPTDPTLAGADPSWRRTAERLLAEPAGRPLGRLVIPGLGLSDVVVQGVAHDELADGPGHYPGTSLPGLGGTVAFAGHRTTYGAPFRHLDDLRPGERLTLRLPYATFEYAVIGTRIVSPQDTAVLTGPRGRERLVLTTCHPLYSARQRMVVTARLVRTRAPA